jgi:hypothetical protein
MLVVRLRQRSHRKKALHKNRVRKGEIVSCDSGTCDQVIKLAWQQFADMLESV